KERERRIAGEVMRNMAEAVAVVDDGFRFVAVNPAFTRMSGYEEAEVVGRDASLLDSAQHDAAFYAQSRRSIESSAHWSTEMWQKRKDGREFLCAMQSNALVEPGTGHHLYVLVASDITDRRRIEHELRYLANYDTLTNLPHRTPRPLPPAPPAAGSRAARGRRGRARAGAAARPSPRAPRRTQGTGAGGGCPAAAGPGSGYGRPPPGGGKGAGGGGGATGPRE